MNGGKEYVYASIFGSKLMGDLLDEVNDVNETLRPDEKVKSEEKQEEDCLLKQGNGEQTNN